MRYQSLTAVLAAAGLVAAYIPAVPVNDTSSLVDSDALIHLAWLPNGVYRSVPPPVSFPLPARRSCALGSDPAHTLGLDPLLVTTHSKHALHSSAFPSFLTNLLTIFAFPCYSSALLSRQLVANFTNETSSVISWTKYAKVG